MAAKALDCSTRVISEAFESLEADSHGEDSKNAEMGPIASETDPGSGKKMIVNSLRAEIDTSAPFESVKEAANRFGGMCFWRPLPRKPSQHEFEAVDMTQVEEQAVQLEKDVMAKERETLDVLKELETTKMFIEELKLKLQKEASEVSAPLNANLDDENVNPCLEYPIDISRALRQLSSEVEQYRKMGEAAKSEVLRAMSAIEHTKTRIKTSETRLVAAKKMKEAARATDALALAEIKVISSNELKPEGVTLSCEEYASLISKAREAEEASKSKVINTMLLVDETKISKMEILKTVEAATEEVKTSKQVLEEALDRVEAANRAKLPVEEAMRKWRSENGQRRRSVQNSKKFKKSSCPSHHRKDDAACLIDVNGLNLLNDDCKSVLRPTLSIGQILSRKLFLTEEFGNGLKLEKGGAVKRKMSLGQMLSRPNCETPFTFTRKAERDTGHKQLPVKRKKFGFPRFSDPKREKIKQKKKPTPSFMCHCE